MSNTQYQESCTEKLGHFCVNYTHKGCVCQCIMHHGYKEFQKSYALFLDIRSSERAGFNCQHHRWVLILSSVKWHHLLSYGLTKGSDDDLSVNFFLIWEPISLWKYDYQTHKSTPPKIKKLKTKRKKKRRGESREGGNKRGKKGEQNLTTISSASWLSYFLHLGFLWWLPTHLYNWLLMMTS